MTKIPENQSTKAKCGLCYPGKPCNFAECPDDKSGRSTRTVALAVLALVSLCAAFHFGLNGDFKTGMFFTIAALAQAKLI